MTRGIGHAWRTLSVLAAVAVVATACTAPDADEGNGETTPEPSVTSTAAAPTTAPETTVTELNIPTAEAPWLASFKEVLAAYEEETGIKVNLTAFPFDGLMTQESNAAQTGSNAFDVFTINEQWTGLFYDNQWVQPLTDIDPGFAWDPELIEFDGVGRWDVDSRTTALDGEPYALPINGNIQEYMYRTDLYDQLGLAVPKTWDEAIANGQAATDAGVADLGFAVRGKTPSYDFSNLLYTYGGQYFVDEAGGDWTPSIDTPEFRQALETFKALADIGPDAPQTIAQAEAISLLQGGSLLQSMLVAASASSLEDPEASLVAGSIGYAETPGSTPVSGTWVMGIPVGLPAERAAAAMDFLTWLTSKDVMQKWADLGGVTTRADVETSRPELQVIVDSADDIRAGFRYPFTPAFLDVTDPAIGSFLAGETNLDETVAKIQDGLTQVVTDAGYLK